MGATGKTFVLNIFLERICRRDDPAIKTNIPPIIPNAIILPVRSPTTASVAPKAKDPPSPIKILAGQTLKYKKANNVPIQMPIKEAKVKSSAMEAIPKKANRQIKSKPADKPSNPSEIL